jgi:putative ABC transport system permease protein
VRLEALPGIDRVSGASAVPFSGEGGSSSFDIEGRPVPQGEKKPEAHRRTVLPGYHEMLGISLIAGRTFTPADGPDAVQVVIVSQSLADQFWPGENALGQFIVRDGQRREIVGIVSDILHADLTGTHQSTFYVPFYQEAPNRFWLVVGASMPLDALIPAIRRTVSALAPTVAVGRVNALGQLVEESTAPARFRATLVAIFGGCSLLLAAVGIFGVTARMVSARQREMGIRIALGARNEELTRTIVLTESKPVALGVVIGLGAAALSVRALDSFLYGVSFYDVPTFVGTALLLGTIGIVASYVPARLTAKANPLEVLRAE